MDYGGLKKIIKEYSIRSKYFEKDFFPHKTIKTKAGRFELLALSIMDVRGFNADKLWYIVGKNLRSKNKNILSIDYLHAHNISTITKELKKAGYNRGEIYTKRVANLLKKLALRIKTNYSGDVALIFNKNEIHDSNYVNKILKELDKLPGVGLKIATMYFKFMVSTF